MDARFILLLACFVGSGFAGLVYQTAWTRELSFVFGTSELAVAAVLAAYMGGLALGAAAAARWALRLRRPILAYGLLELAIAICALAVPAGLRGVEHLYASLLGGSPELPERSQWTALLQLAGAFAVLLPPTALMGATLPLLARYAVRSDGEIGSRVGVLYAANTLGAIAGTVSTAFWLIPEFGLRRSVWVGAAVNAIAFVVACALARGAPPPPERDSTIFGAEERPFPWILPAMALSGAVSFAYEVLWTRLLGHVLGGSLDAFAAMLASFLAGIALGSAGAGRLATTRERALAGFAIAQLGIALTSLATFALANRLPALAHALGAGPVAPIASAALAAFVLLPITLCIGATFPFAVRVLAVSAEHAARSAARIYAWNTIGALSGALGAGFVLLPGLGFAGTVSLCVGASLLLAAGSAAPTPRRAPILALAGASGLLMALAPVRTPWSLLRHSPLPATTTGAIVFAGVGRSSTVIAIDGGRDLRLTTNGLSEAKIDRAGAVASPRAISTWLGLLPALIRPDTRDLLVVGLGGGSALEVVPSSVAAIDVIELEAEVVAANRAIARLRANDPLSDPRVRVQLGDARGALRLTEKRYDAIVSQPSHPWTAGSSHLYTREFFARVQSRLKPSGVFIQWIAPPFVDEALVRSLLSALVEVFGHVELYAPSGEGFLFAASPAPIAGIAGARRALHETPNDYARFGLHRVEDFASSWLLDEDGARALAAGATPNSDDDNRLAARSLRLGNRPLDSDSAIALFAPYDPLASDGAHELEPGALLRSLVLRGQEERARKLARALDGAAEELGLGWVDLLTNRVRSAARHFGRARAIAPGNPEALLGLVGSRRADLALGAVAEIPEGAVEEPVASLIEGWRRARRGDWAGVVAIDATLARISPGDALFREAALLRSQWRVELGDQNANAEGVAIMEQLLVNFWRGDDALLHARAAIAAGESETARMTLDQIGDRAPATERGRDLLRRALAVANELPDEGAGGLRRKLARRAEGAL